MRSYWSRKGPNPTWLVSFYREDKRRRQTQRGEDNVTEETETGLMQRHAQKRPELPAARKLEEAGRSPPRASEGQGCVGTLASDFWPPGQWESTFLLFQATQCVVLCPNSPWTWIYCPTSPVPGEKRELSQPPRGSEHIGSWLQVPLLQPRKVTCVWTKVRKKHVKWSVFRVVELSVSFLFSNPLNFLMLLYHLNFRQG